MTGDNTFYNEFDQTLFSASKVRQLHHRTPYQQDRDRIIYSSSFRRLQAKTQVFFSGEYDFYRTRLTHSIEVSQIGRSICYHLLKTSPYLNKDFYVDADLVEAVCLSHDIGHPPFGHAGESSLHHLMKDFGGFEGNAQTLRILTDTIYSSSTGRTGMNPTRAFTDGVLKYKALFSESLINGQIPKNHFLYDEQKPVLQFVFDQQRLPAELDSTEAVNSFRSIECQIMDWADDTAFSINDVVDGVASGLITVQKIENWASKSSLNGEESGWISKILDVIKSKTLQKRFSMKIGDMINACSLEPVRNFMSERTHRYGYRLNIDSAAQREAKLYSRLSRELVFRSPQIYQLEFKAEQMLKKMFAAFQEHYLKDQPPRMALLPNDTEQMVLRESDMKIRARLICDYISGMTDVFAIRTYKRLFDPDFGSIGDLI